MSRKFRKKNKRIVISCSTATASDRPSAYIEGKPDYRQHPLLSLCRITRKLGPTGGNTSCSLMFYSGQPSRMLSSSLQNTASVRPSLSVRKSHLKADWTFCFTWRPKLDSVPSADQEFVSYPKRVSSNVVNCLEWPPECFRLRARGSC